jgi:integrase
MRHGIKRAHEAVPHPALLRERGWTVPGSIQQRGRKYSLLIYAGSENGKKRYKRISGFSTRAEAEAAQARLASHVRAHAAGVGFFGHPRLRLGPYLRDWLDGQRTRLAPATWERYEDFVEQICRDAIGAVPLARLSPRALEAYYERRLAAGQSPTTAHHQHRLLHKALRDAVRQDLIVQNPASAAQPPRRAKPRLDVWSEPQVLLFLSEARSRSPHYPLYLFIAATGARVGEALGLEWRSLDRREGVAHIEQALQRRGRGYSLREPKSDRSRRAVALPPEVTGVLRDLRDRQEEERRRRVPCERGPECALAACGGWHETGLVFAQPNGKPLHANNVRQRDLRRLCARLGLPWRRALHNLRHAHATHLLQRGVNPRVVSERLGHATAAFTLSTYAHVLAGMQGQAAAAVSEWLSGTGSRRQPESDPPSSTARH